MTKDKPRNDKYTAVTALHEILLIFTFLIIIIIIIIITRIP